MICPIYKRKSQYTVCPRCGYYLENDLINNSFLKTISLKKLYNELIKLRKERSKLNKAKANVLYNRGYKYFGLRIYASAENYFYKLVSMII